jgi:hypothetical protein
MRKKAKPALFLYLGSVLLYVRLIHEPFLETMELWRVLQLSDKNQIRYGLQLHVENSHVNRMSAPRDYVHQPK